MPDLAAPELSGTTLVILPPLGATRLSELGASLGTRDRWFQAWPA
jgi:hypothetical protein